MTKFSPTTGSPRQTFVMTKVHAMEQGFPGATPISPGALPGSGPSRASRASRAKLRHDEVFAHHRIALLVLTDTKRYTVFTVNDPVN